jgi:hypothetical protein
VLVQILAVINAERQNVVNKTLKVTNQKIEEKNEQIRESYLHDCCGGSGLHFMQEK